MACICICVSVHLHYVIFHGTLSASFSIIFGLNDVPSIALVAELMLLFFPSLYLFHVSAPLDRFVSRSLYGNVRSDTIFQCYLQERYCTQNTFFPLFFIASKSFRRRAKDEEGGRERKKKQRKTSSDLLTPQTHHVIAVLPESGSNNSSIRFINSSPANRLRWLAGRLCNRPMKFLYHSIRFYV